MDSSLDAIIVIDELGEITDWNSAAGTTFSIRIPDVIRLPEGASA